MVNNYTGVSILWMTATPSAGSHGGAFCSPIYASNSCSTLGIQDQGTTVTYTATIADGSTVVYPGFYYFPSDTNWANVYFTLNVYLAGGGPGSGVNTTNSACLTLQNETGAVEYYQFGQTGGYTAGGTNYPSTQSLSGCSTGISVNGVNGFDGNSPNEFMAVYPGESVTVCSVFTQALPYGSTAIPPVFNAYAAPAGSYPCGGLTVAGQRCVTLCGPNDGLAVTTFTNGTAAFASNPMGPAGGSGQSGGVATNGGFGVSTNVLGLGTNSIPWPSGTNGVLIPTLQTGFAAVVGAVQSTGALVGGDIVAETGVLSNGLRALGSALGVSNLLGSNTNLGALSNLNVLTNLQFPTNFPDASAVLNLQGLSNMVAGYVRNTSNWMAGGVSNAGGMVDGGFSMAGNPSGYVGWQSNQGAAAGASLAAGYGSLVSTNWGNVTINSGSGGSQWDLVEIAGQQGLFAPLVLDISEASMPAVAAHWYGIVYDCLCWVIYVLLLKNFLDEVDEMITGVVTQPQVRVPNVTVFGMSVGLPVALLIVTAVLAFVSSLPTAVSAYVSTVSGSAAAKASSIGAISSSPYWTMMMSYVPFGVTITAFFNWFTFRFVVCKTLLYIGRGIVARFVACFVVLLFSCGSGRAMTLQNLSSFYVELVVNTTNEAGVLVSHNPVLLPGQVVVYPGYSSGSYGPFYGYTNAASVGGVLAYVTNTLVVGDQFDPPVSVGLTGNVFGGLAVSVLVPDSWATWWINGFWAAFGIVTCLASVWAVKKGLNAGRDYS